jgi:hypothetical protein
VYLSQAFAGADETTYRFDKDRLGGISGYESGREDVFYAMCRLEVYVVCFDMSWDAKEQDIYGPIAARIARSFRARIVDHGSKHWRS